MTDLYRCSSAGVFTSSCSVSVVPGSCADGLVAHVGPVVNLQMNTGYTVASSV